MKALGGGDAAGMHGKGPTQGWGGQGTRGARTSNMLNMLVTLDVSKLSGWLKASAYCRVESGPAMWDEVRPGRGEGAVCSGDAISMHGKGQTQNWGSGHAQSARRTSAPWS